MKKTILATVIASTMIISIPSMAFGPGMMNMEGRDKPHNQEYKDYGDVQSSMFKAFCGENNSPEIEKKKEELANLTLDTQIARKKLELEIIEHKMDRFENKKERMRKNFEKDHKSWKKEWEDKDPKEKEKLMEEYRKRMEKRDLSQYPEEKRKEILKKRETIEKAMKDDRPEKQL